MQPGPRRGRKRAAEGGRRRRSGCVCAEGGGGACELGRHRSLPVIGSRFSFGSGSQPHGSGAAACRRSRHPPPACRTVAASALRAPRRHLAPPFPVLFLHATGRLCPGVTDDLRVPHHLSATFHFGGSSLSLCCSFPGLSLEKSAQTGSLALTGRRTAPASPLSPPLCPPAAAGVAAGTPLGAGGAGGESGDLAPRPPPSEVCLFRDGGSVPLRRVLGAPNSESSIAWRVQVVGDFLMGS